MEHLRQRWSSAKCVSPSQPSAVHESSAVPSAHFDGFVRSLLQRRSDCETVLQRCHSDGVHSLEALRRRDKDALKQLGFGLNDIQRIRDSAETNGCDEQTQMLRNAGVDVVAFHSSENAKISVGKLTTNSQKISRAEGDSEQFFGEVIQKVGAVDNNLSLTKGAVKAFQERVCLAGAGAYLTLKYIEELPKAAKAVCGIFSRTEKRVFGTGFVMQNGAEHVIVTALHNVWKDLTKVVREQRRVPDAWKKFDPMEPELSQITEKVQIFAETSQCVFDYNDESQEGRRFFSFPPGSEALVAWYPKLDVIILRLEQRTVDGVEPLVPMSREDEERLIKKDNRCLVIGHPVFPQGQGQQDFKLVSMQRENVFHEVVDNFVRYFTDTEGGNSGSPVLVWDELTKRFLVAAVHHTGVEAVLEDKRRIGYNEGSLITRAL